MLPENGPMITKVLNNLRISEVLSVSSRHIRALWPGYLLFAYEKPAFCLFESFRPASVPQSNARPTGDQEVAGSIPAGSGNSLSWRLIMK